MSFEKGGFREDPKMGTRLFGRQSYNQIRYWEYLKYFLQHKIVHSSIVVSDLLPDSFRTLMPSQQSKKILYTLGLERS